VRRQDFVDLYQSETTLWWFVGMEKILKELLRSSAKVFERGLILDAGSGTGGNLEAMNNWYKPELVVGFDYSLDALEFSKKRTVQNLFQASTTDLPFKDESFHLVTSLDVLVQLSTEVDVKKALKELVRVTKPGGVIVIRAAAYKWLRSKHDQALQSRHRFSLEELSNLCQDSGLEVVRKSYLNCFLLPVAVLHRTLNKFTSTEPSSDVKPPSGLFFIPNLIFTLVLYFENLLLSFGLNLPFGLSTICVCRKASKN